MDHSGERLGFKFKTAFAKARSRSPFHTPKSLSPTTISASGKITNPIAQESSNLVPPEKILLVSSATKKDLKPIKQLWDEAYNDLHQQNASLVEKFNVIMEATLSRSALPDQGLPLEPSNLSDVQKAEKMKMLLEKQIKDIEDGAWKLKFKEHELLVKDLVLPVARVVDWAKEFVGSALKASPSASIAWAGVCLLLPLILKPATQESTRLKALEEIASIISECNIREDLYEQRYHNLANPGGNQEASHGEYRAVLKSLYVKILTFQMTAVCYLSNKTLTRMAKDIVVWNDWDALLRDITGQELKLKSMDQQWRDLKYEEECKLLKIRHEERLDGLGAIEKEVSRLKQVMSEAQYSSERHSLLNWLSSTDPSDNYNAARQKHASTTCSWLVDDSHDFKNWKNLPNSQLWLCGKAGAGKSILSSSVIHQLDSVYHQDPYTALAYFYFRFDDTNKQTNDGLVRSILKQLCAQAPNIPLSVTELRRFLDVGHQPDSENLENALFDTIQCFENVYIVLDALDECPLIDNERDRLLAFLIRMGDRGLQNLHLLYTSRKERDIETAFNVSIAEENMLIIDLGIILEEVNRDIEAYIDLELKLGKHRSWPAQVKSEIKIALVEKADGMFQYVALQLRSIEETKSIHDLREALYHLPNGLDETYIRSLNNIPEQYQAHARRALQWLSFCVEPLKLSELAEAAVIDPNKPIFDTDTRLLDPTLILELLPGLVILGPEAEIRFAHFSAKEFLLCDRIKDSSASSFAIEVESSHAHIAIACLFYHMHIWNVKPSCFEWDLNKGYDLSEYAARYWINHAESVHEKDLSSSVVDTINQVLRPGTLPLLITIRFWSSSWSLRPYTAELDPSFLFRTVWQRWAESFASTLNVNLNLEVNILRQDPPQTKTASSTEQYHNQQGLGHTLCKSVGLKAHPNIVHTFPLRDPGGGNSFVDFFSPPTPFNLGQYWYQHPFPEFSRNTILWGLTQLEAIASALNWAHILEAKAYGDESLCWGYRGIDANHIFWYPTNAMDGAEITPNVLGGSLKLSHYTLEAIFRGKLYPANARRPPAIIGPYNANLTPFEFGLAGDIWKLACLYLNFITWLLEGVDKQSYYWNGMAQSTDIGSVILFEYYNTCGGGRNPAVDWWGVKLRQNKNCTNAIHDVLDLVLDHCFVGEPEDRMTSAQVEDALTKIRLKAEDDLEYMMSPAPRKYMKIVPEGKWDYEYVLCSETSLTGEEV